MDEPIQVALATASAFLQAAEAERVVLILDRPGEDAAMVDVDAFLTAEVTVGDVTTPVTHGDYADTAPKPLPAVTPIPPTAITVDLETDELAAPIGAIEQLANAVLALAGAFGGQTVASVEFGTSDPELPITFAARTGERVILSTGDVEFEL
jgi:hypothetical protein